MIKKIAQEVHKYGLDVPAIILMDTFKPLSNMGAQFGRFFLFPFLPFLGNNMNVSGEKFFQLLENKESVEKLIVVIEEVAREEEEQKKAKKSQKLMEKRAEKQTEDAPKKKSWWSFLKL